MTRPTHHRPASPAVTVISAAAVAVLAASVAACQPVVTSSAATSPPAATAAATGSAAAAADPATSPPADPATSPPADPATSPPASAAGSVTAAMSSPASLSGTVAVAVACTAGRVYRAAASSAVIDGDQLTFSVATIGYRGPGSYSALVTATLRESTGLVTTVTGVPSVPAAITSTGGSFTISATGSAGRHFSGTLSWVCGS